MTARASFREKYEAAAAANDSLLCVGLDPDPSRLPPGVDIDAWLREVIEATSDLVCCYKPNAAFFEARGPHGQEALWELIDGIPDEIPVLLDAKRGDVGHSAEFYARAVFEVLGADAVTVNPYLGGDAVEPFLAHEDRHTFVLCRTSNAGAGELQDRALAASGGGRPLYMAVAERANAWNTRGNVGLVVGATYPAEARAIRELCPDMLFLMPGVGAQAGELGGRRPRRARRSRRRDHRQRLAQRALPAGRGAPRRHAPRRSGCATRSARRSALRTAAGRAD